MDFITNQDLQLAYDFVRYTNRNIFLTGKAGTGKTTFLHTLKKSSPKRMIVLAPTGVAAINAGGVTIHSFFQLPFHPYVPSVYLQGTPGRTSEQKESQGYKMSREKVNIIRSLDLIIIDEISMVRADVLDAIDAALRRYRNHYLPFGGIQLLMIGDLRQLAPVAKDEDLQILRDYYDTLYFFGSRALASTDYVTIELKHIFRQTDTSFINLLNRVRNNQADAMVLDELNKRYIPNFDADTAGGYITLTTHNHQASTLNDSKLEKLPGESRSFIATVKDDFPEISYPNVSELLLKEGAQVMFVKNDITKEKLYFNGKIGKVTGFDGEAVFVSCPGENFIIRVEPVEWQNVKYTLDDETKEIAETVIGTFTQYPLRLAWAITIHKSQGLTFERAVIDARSAFAHGQVYVALSRCRTLEGIVLNSRIGSHSIIDDPVVTGFARETDQKQPGQKELAISKKTYTQNLLKELFDFSIIIRNLSYSINIITEHQESILGKPGEKLEIALLSVRSELVPVAEKFHLQLDRLLANDADAETNNTLQERVKKAAEFFSARLEASLNGIHDGFTVETDNKTVRRAVKQSLDRLRKECLTKLACLDDAKTGFSISRYLDVRARAGIDIPPVKSREPKTVTDTTGEILDQALFQKLREWRNNKAAELKLPHYMIMHQKTMLTIANLAPQNMASLKKIRGMGKKKSEKFGEELLEIILESRKASL